MTNNKIVLYIAMSLDGFIADSTGSIGFLDKYNDLGEDYGYKEFFSSITNVIMGNTTYKQVGGTKEFEEYYKDNPVFVFSRKPKTNKKNITFVNEDVEKFAKKLKNKSWMVGGASILNEFLKHDLIDEFIITIIPILLGDGIPLFKNNSLNLKLIETKQFNDVIQLHYRKV